DWLNCRIDNLRAHIFLIIGGVARPSLDRKLIGHVIGEVTEHRSLPVFVWPVSSIDNARGGAARGSDVQRLRDRRSFLGIENTHAPIQHIGNLATDTQFFSKLLGLRGIINAYGRAIPQTVERK